MTRLIKFLHHLFIPHEHNNYKVKSLHIDALSVYLIVAIFTAFFLKDINHVSGNILGFATDITVEKLYTLTNKERAKINLSPLIYNEKLAKAAQEKAQDMFQKDYWAHYAPDGKTPWDFMINSGYKYEYAGENLAKNFLFSDGVVDAWMKSEGHRANILRKEYEEIGFAIVNGVLNGEETTLVIQMFGKPQTFNLSQDVNKKTYQQPEKLIENKPVVYNQPSILSKDANAPKINLLRTVTRLNFVFIFFLIIALILDFYFAAKTRIFRVSGKNLAHLIFLGFILVGLFFITKGSIM